MFWRRLARLPSLAIRQLRWQRGAWSKDSDRDYHEQLYDAQDYDAFSPDYPGYLTIRRFADHVGVLLPSAGTVLDVGCGPGEITCELARRHPQLAFMGIDHSAQAIARATRNAARLCASPTCALRSVTRSSCGAGNLRAGDDVRCVSPSRAAARFSRLAAPADDALCADRAGGHVERRLGARLDFDWLLGDLASVRDRIEAACGVSIAPASVRRRRNQPTSMRRSAVKARSSVATRSMISSASSTAGNCASPARSPASTPIRRVRTRKARCGRSPTMWRTNDPSDRRSAPAAESRRGSEALGDCGDDGSAA